MIVTGSNGYIGSIFSETHNKKVKYFVDFYHKKKLKNRCINKDVKFISEKNFKDKVDTIIHFAAFKSIPESFLKPLEYYDNNINSTLNLLQICQKLKINYFIYSSSASVYENINAGKKIDENCKTNPINPYSRTKLISENLIRDFCYNNRNFKSIILRYFNPLGSNENHSLYDFNENNTNVMHNICKAVYEKKAFKVFGYNYDTKDGSAIRDYVHVQDLVKAHFLTLNYMKKNNILKSDIINIGTGIGTSVFELVRTFEKVNDVKCKVVLSNKRPGDLPYSVADNSKMKRVLKWVPKISLSKMCLDSWKSYLNYKKQ